MKKKFLIKFLICNWNWLLLLWQGTVIRLALKEKFIKSKKMLNVKSFLTVLFCMISFVHMFILCSLSNRLNIIESNLLPQVPCILSKYRRASSVSYAKL